MNKKNEIIKNSKENRTERQGREETRGELKRAKVKATKRRRREEKGTEGTTGK